MTGDRAIRRSVWLPRWWPLLALALFAVGYAAFVGLAWWIQASARETGAKAMQEFSGDRVEALVQMVQSEAHPLAARNRAVWALGIIGDPRALPTLERAHTGEPCQHDRLLCQYELKKAIEKCEGKGRAPAWMPFMPR